MKTEVSPRRAAVVRCALSLCLAGVAGMIVLGQSAPGQKSVQPQALPALAAPSEAQIAAIRARIPDTTPVQRGSFGPCRTYTTFSDFEEGFMFNVEPFFNPATGEQCLRLRDQPRAWPFIGIANSSRGTAVRVAVDNSIPGVNEGDVVGEYRTAPQTRPTNPSRTTVDAYGNIWLTNRSEGGPVNGVDKGSVARIGLVIGGTRVDAAGVPDPTGEYLQGPFNYCTCEDRDGDGLIRTSLGYPWAGGVSDYSPTFLGWDAALSGADDAGGVATADDECITAFVRVAGTGARFIGIDPAGDVWTGGWGNKYFEKLDGNTAQPVPASAFDSTFAGYGGLVDKENILWSASPTMRYQAPGGPVQNVGVPSYGVAIDPVTNYVWVTAGSEVRRMDRAGALNGGPWAHGGGNSQGLVVDSSGNVWVAHSANPSINTVGRIATTGLPIGNVNLDINPSTVQGRGPTGVAVDNNGKVWSTNYFSNNTTRIDPTLGAAGMVDLVVDLGGNSTPYNYSDMTGSVFLEAVAPQGSWTVVHDGGMPGCDWGLIDWNAIESTGTGVKVRVRASDSPIPGGPWTPVTNGVPFSGVVGQYLQIQVTLCRTAKTDGDVMLCDLTVCKRNECMTLADGQISCEIGPDGAPVFYYTFTVTNNSGVGAAWALLTPQSPSGLMITPNVIPLNPVLANGASTVISAAIEGISEGEEFCFTITLLTPDFQECCSVTICEIAECPCLSVEDKLIECDPDGQNSYTYTFWLTNETLDDIWHVYLFPPPGVNISPNYFNIVNLTSAPLSPGGSVQLTVNISGPNAIPGTTICFVATIHNRFLEMCCKEPVYVTLPSCDDPTTPNHYCHLTTAANCCLPQPEVLIRLTICNTSETTVKEFDWSIESVPSAGLPGLPPGCITPASGVAVVPPGLCLTIPINVNCDCLYAFGPGAMANLVATVVNAATGDAVHCEGKVTAPGQWWVLPGDGMTGDTPLLTVPVGAVARVTFTAINGADKGGQLHYRVATTSAILEADGAPGGSELIRTVDAQIGASAQFFTDVSFSSHDPTRIHDVIIYADVNSDGVLIPAASVAVRSAPHSEGLDCPGDINCDGLVGSADLGLLLGSWGTADTLTDLNGDGIVGAADLAILLGSWGPCL